LQEEFEELGIREPIGFGFLETLQAVTIRKDAGFGRVV
jgi:hypothetical protein